jgi:hypothetical protein
LALAARLRTSHRPHLAAAPPATIATPSPPSAPTAAPPAEVMTRLSLRMSPANARVVWVAADGSQSIENGPWSSDEPRQFAWAPGRRPRRARAEADGYEPAILALPDEGQATALVVRLVRHRAGQHEPPRHHDLSYPWRDR